jgi:hypothetical protein
MINVHRKHPLEYDTRLVLETRISDLALYSAPDIYYASLHLEIVESIVDPQPCWQYASSKTLIGTPGLCI